MTRVTLIAACLCCAASSVAAQSQAGDFSVKMPPERWAVINRALQEAPIPFRETYPVILELNKQIEEQQKARRESVAPEPPKN